MSNTSSPCASLKVKTTKFTSQAKFNTVGISKLLFLRFDTSPRGKKRKLSNAFQQCVCFPVQERELI